MTALFYTVLPILPLVIWSMIFLYSFTSTEGQELLRFHVPFLARLKMLAVPAILVAVLLITLLILGRARWWSLLVAVVACGIVLCWPQNYPPYDSWYSHGAGTVPALDRVLRCDQDLAPVPRFRAVREHPVTPSSSVAIAKTMSL